MTVLITGASGHLGRQAVEFALASGSSREVIAGTRDPTKLTHLTERGVKVRRVDFDDSHGLVEAFRDVERVLLISTDAVGEPGARGHQHRLAIDAARQAKVAHIVYTSLTNPTEDNPVMIGVDHRETERALQESGIGWTSLRNNIYSDGLPATFARAVKAGSLSNAIDRGAIGYVARIDAARAAAEAVMGDGLNGEIIDVTGPAAVMQVDLIEIVEAEFGRPIRYQPVSPDQLVERLTAGGMQNIFAKLIASFDEAASRGFFAVVSNSVKELTGVTPLSVREVLAENRDQFVGASV